MKNPSVHQLKHAFLRIAPAAVVALSFAAITACDAQSGKFQKSKNGLEYLIARDNKQTKVASVGDFLEFHIKTKFNDSVLFDSRTMNNNNPVPFRLPPAAFKGDLSEGLTMMSAGDSAVFRVSIDSMLKAGAQPMPGMEAGKGQKLTYIVALVSVKDEKTKQADDAKSASAQVGKDDQAIQDYLKAKGVTTAKKTASGMYYKIDQTGNGAMPAKGDNVTMNYTGMLLNGQKFDSNVDPAFNHVQPFNFALGVGQVIKGWDEGIALLPKGTKGTLYIPSGLAYGSQDRGAQIPANSVLIFDVEVVDVAKK